MYLGKRYDRAAQRKRRGRALGLSLCALVFFGAIAWVFRENLVGPGTRSGSSLRGFRSGTRGGRRALDPDAGLHAGRHGANFQITGSDLRNADVASINSALGEAAERRGHDDPDAERTVGQRAGSGEVTAVSDDVSARTRAVAKGTKPQATDSITASELEKPASTGAVAQGIGADAVSKLEAFHVAWADRPLPESNSVDACARELEAQDQVPPPRDFNALPIRVFSSEVRSWQCGVPCEFTRDGAQPYDASLGGDPGKGLLVLRSMEAAAYYHQNNVATAKKAGFDIVMTVHYDSDVPVQYGSWEEYKLMRELQPKDPNVGLAAAFISNCAATNFRLVALEALQKYVKVDSYGRCNHNTGDAYVDKQETLMKYKFSLAFENSCEPDYVTEKFWQSLVAGAVPIVVGAPNIHQFAPNNHSFFHIKTVEDVPAVAEKMKALAADDEAWKRMVDWKWKGPSDFFLANMDISTVHSSCRLCILIADKLTHKASSAKRQQRPCRCRAGSAGSFLYHFYVRERFSFNYTSIFLESSQLTLAELTKAVHKAFSEMSYQPVWARKRPPSLATEDVVKALRIFRIYPSGLTQKDALQGDKWFQNDEQLLQHIASNPCSNLEVIFV